MKRLGIMVLFMIFLVLPLSASMVSFLVVEEGVRPGVQAGDYSTAWEDGLMGAFFDAGHIVSNSPVLRIERLSDGELPPELNVDYREAYEGGADYFLIAVLEYRPQETKPYSVCIKIFTTLSQRLIYEQRFPAGTGVNSRDEYNKALETARIVVAQLR
jgi:hypothetical protein